MNVLEILVLLVSGGGNVSANWLKNLGTDTTYIARQVWMAGAYPSQNIVSAIAEANKDQP
jgi:hypothetical protein